MVTSPAILSALALILLVFIYKDDSPLSLLNHGLPENAARVLEKIYVDRGEAEERLEELVEQMQRESTDPFTKPGFLTMLRRPGVAMAFFVGCVLSFGQQAGKSMLL